MKLNKIYILFLLVVMLAISCEDHIERSPLGEYSTENYFATLDGANQGLIGAYSWLRQWPISGWPYIFMGDVASDDAIPGADDNNATAVAINEWTGVVGDLQFDNNTCESLFNGNYTLIARANLLINAQDEFEFSEEEKTLILAQARFLRGFAYFNLVKAFGGVPLITTPRSIDEFIPRSTDEEIWAQSDADLIFAAENLPEKSEYAEADLGRVTAGAAKAMLARSYLFRNDFPNVKKYAGEVIASGEYALVTTSPNDLHPYEWIFTLDGENCAESVFEIQATYSASNIVMGINKYSTVFGPTSTEGATGWGVIEVSADLEAAYEPDDPRRDMTIAYNGDTLYDGRTVVTQETRFNQKAILPIYAFDGINPVLIGGDNANNPLNVRVIRYADVLLMYAEALNDEESGDPLMYVNEIRDRVQMPPVNVSGKEAIRDAIWHERRVELAMEQQRYWDILRQGRAEQLLRAVGIEAYEAEKHKLLPIPFGEIQITNGVLEQNPHW